MKNSFYARKLETDLIAEFKETFHKQLGYYPVVLVRHEVSCLEVSHMPLDKLISYFEPFLPYRFGVRLSLTSRHRYRELVELRCIYFFIAKQLGYTLAVIGHNHFHHTTVLHGLKMFNNLIETDVAFKEKYQKVVDHISVNHPKSAFKHESSIMESVSDTQRDPERALLS